MEYIQKKCKRIYSLCLLVLLLLVSCAGSTPGFSGDKPTLSDPSFQRDIQPVKLAEYVGDRQVTEENNGRSGLIDYTNISEGYVVAATTASVKAKFRVIYDDNTWYDYAMDSDGSYQVYPLARGDGRYRFAILLHVDGNGYEVFLEYEQDVIFASEQVPFTVQNKIINYDENSRAIAKAHELVKNCSNDLEAAQQIYYWIRTSIVYDRDKADLVLADKLPDYVPDLDVIMETGTGICFDYAALAAAMLRSNGIPTRLIMGDVNTDNGLIYHAWNEFWTEEAGWIAVKIEVKGGSWNRVDLTFAASNNSNAEFVGNGNNYYETSFH